jgi:hypothetical protein
MLLLGIIDLVAAPLAEISPLRILNALPGVQLSDLVLAAGVAAIPANLGSTAASQAVQVYVNRYVPVRTQGGIFGMGQVQENALNLMTIFLLGLVAMVTGPQYIFIVAPLVVTLVVLSLLRYSYRHMTGETPALMESIDFIVDDVPPQKIKQVRPSHKRRRSQSS